MKQSESITELAIALCAAQADMGGAVKDSANPFFKSKYADLGSVVKAIKEPFAAHGLSYTQFPCSSDGAVGVTTRLMHNSGQWLESSFTLPMVKADPQAAGAAITYARRYALQAMAGIPTADDDAESAMFRTSEPKFTDVQKEEFYEFIQANNDPLGFLCFTKTVGDEVFTALQGTFPPGQIVSGKKIANQLITDGFEILHDTVAQVDGYVQSHDTDGLLEIIDAFQTPIQRKLLGGLLKPEHLKAIKEVKELAA